MLWLMIIMTIWDFSNLCGQLAWFPTKHTRNLIFFVILNHLSTAQTLVIRWRTLQPKNLETLIHTAYSLLPALLMLASLICCLKESMWALLYELITYYIFLSSPPCDLSSKMHWYEGLWIILICLPVPDLRQPVLAMLEWALFKVLGSWDFFDPPSLYSCACVHLDACNCWYQWCL